MEEVKVGSRLDMGSALDLYLTTPLSCKNILLKISG